jgi:pimeloyl-ACP methyl ester carboxylesterase
MSSRLLLVLAQMSTGMLRLLPLLAAAHALSVGTTRTVTFEKQRYDATITDGDASLPPLVLIPPVGVGIDRAFWVKFQRVWDGGAATHAPDLLGTGTAAPKPRKFYGPEVWARQLDAYVRDEVGRPCTLVVQGGLLPCALEMWRLGGRDTIAGVSLLSPPPLRFVCDDADEPWTAKKAGAPPPGPPTPRASRRIQRLAWAASASPVGNLFFRRLRGKRGARIRDFTDKNLFAGECDDAWVEQCVAAARDSRGRFATLAYLCGTIPGGGAWRDDRGAVLDALDAPTQIIRGDFPGAFDPANRTAAALARLPRPADSFVVPGARACLPYEQPELTAAALRHFVAGGDPPATLTLVAAPAR